MTFRTASSFFSLPGSESFLRDNRDRSRVCASQRADGSGRVQAVHDRHHDVHQDHVKAARFLFLMAALWSMSRLKSMVNLLPS